MLLFIFFQSTLSFSGEGISIDPLKPPSSNDNYQFQKTNTTIPETLNLTLINEIREMMSKIDFALRDIKVGSKNINESLQYLKSQIESPNSTFDIRSINDNLNLLEKLTKGYSNEVDNLISKMVTIMLNEILFYQEIEVNYIPKKLISIIHRSDIKPITQPTTQSIQYPNFTFETRRPYAAKKISFDSEIDMEDSSVVEANLYFYLKRRIIYSQEECIINGKNNIVFEFPHPILFDKFVIQCLRNYGDQDSYTIPTFHLYEPKRIRN